MAQLRRRRFDDLGLRRALSDRLLPVVVGAMAFLAALALAGAMAANSLAGHWQAGGASLVTVQVPDPSTPATAGGTRLDAVLGVLRTTPHIASARAMTDAELADLLRPWLGTVSGPATLPLPAVIEARTDPTGPDNAALAQRLQDVAPGTLAEAGSDWSARLTVLARSLQACAGLVLLMVGFVAVAVLAVTVRAGLSTRREAIEIIHGLGATDGYIARRFAARAAGLAGVGAAIGTLLALPMLLGLAGLAAPFIGVTTDNTLLPELSAPVWVALPLLPVLAIVLGWATAQRTVRQWLRRLP